MLKSLSVKYQSESLLRKGLGNASAANRTSLAKHASGMLDFFIKNTA